MIIGIDLEDYTGVRISAARVTFIAARYNGWFKVDDRCREKEFIKIGFNHLDYIKRKQL